MSCSVNGIQIEPVDITWEIEEQWEVKTVADVSSSLNSKYFKIYAPAGAKFYVWFNVGGAGVDPAPSGFTELEVAISANATAAAVASAAQAIINAHASFVATVDDDTIEITCAAVGDVTDFEDVNTGFTLTKCQDGGSIALGYLEGDVEISTELQTQEITAHQSGTIILAELIQGTSAEVSVTLKENSAELYKNMFAGMGSTYTPMSGTELYGVGDVYLGANTITFARRLILHPVSEGSSKLKDACFWKAYAKPETITHSGENPKVMSVTFKAYRDDSIDGAINMLSFGDWSQLVP